MAKGERKFFFCLDFFDVQNSVRINPIQNCYGDTWEDAVKMAHSILDAYTCFGGGRDTSNFFFYKSMIEFLAGCIFFFIHYDITPYDKQWRELTVRKGRCDADGRQIEPDRYFNKDGVETPVWRWKGRYADLPHVMAFILSDDWMKIFDVLMTDDKVACHLVSFKAAWRAKAMDQLEGMVGTVRIVVACFFTPESAWILSGDEVSLKVDEASGPLRLVVTWARHFFSNTVSTIHLVECYFSLMVNRFAAANRRVAEREGCSVFTVSGKSDDGMFLSLLEQSMDYSNCNFAVRIGDGDDGSGKEKSFPEPMADVSLSCETLKKMKPKELQDFLMEHFMSITNEVEQLCKTLASRNNSSVSLT